LVLPTLRTDTEDFEKSKMAKDLRKLQSDEEWEDFKDQCKVFPNNKTAIQTLTYRILGKIHPKNLYEKKRTKLQTKFFHVSELFRFSLDR